MALLLSPKTIGEPDWEQMNPGDLSDWMTQHYNTRASPRRFETVPWTVEKYACRIDVNWRRPVTLRAKVAATWAALPKLFTYYVLRKR